MWVHKLFATEGGWEIFWQAEQEDFGDGERHLLREVEKFIKKH